MPEIKKGDRVNVYIDPFTVSDLEESATVKTHPHFTGDYDVKQRKMYRCIVKFDSYGHDDEFFRTISELEIKGENL